jgi:uncharacterized membrane protein YbhN (UPF0104 family)
MIDLLYFACLSVLAVALTVLVARSRAWVRTVAETFNARLERFARRVAARVSTASRLDERSQTPALALTLSLLSPAVTLSVVSLSVMIYVVSAVQGQLYFHGLGYEVPLLINLFVTPLLFLLMTLPISFGGIGVREAAFILLYGSFGVPSEIALLVSFCYLLATLLTYLFGAVLFLAGNVGTEGVVQKQHR